jgi:hypothetical protein
MAVIAPIPQVRRATTRATSKGRDFFKSNTERYDGQGSQTRCSSDLWCNRGVRLLGSHQLRRSYPDVRPVTRLQAAAPRTRIVYPDGTRWNQAQPSGLSYFEALAEILGREPVAERDQFFHGIARSLGLQRGTPFAPGDRQRRILTAAAVQGEAIAQANAFHKRFASARYRPGSRWDVVVNIEPGQARDGIGQFFERAAWFYEASGMGEGMAHPAPGLGQAYLGGYTDRDGQWLDGARDYRLVVPPDPPARQFWSVCIYDALTRTIPDNTTKIAEISSRTDPVTNPDGSIELRFGPQPPADTSQSNWIQTIPGRAWFAYLRLYGPTESYFDRSWPLGDIHPA